jgi:hypothetical protein
LYFEEEEEEEKRISSALSGRGIHKAQQLSFVFLFVIMQPASRLKRIFLFSFSLRSMTKNWLMDSSHSAAVQRESLIESVN